MYLIYLLIINVIAFSLFGIDKFKAGRRLWRIPEKMLFLSAILGGSIGAILGMQIFRHKTKHKTFTIGIPTILMVQILLVIIIL